MKTMKKLLTLLVALAMVMSFGSAALASGEASGESSGEASAEETPLYGELAGPAGDNAVVSYHEDQVVYVSDGVEKTAVIGEGQTAYLSVGGVNVVMQPGNYNGTVVVDVVDPIFESDEYQKGDKDVDLSTDICGVKLENPFLLSSSVVASTYDMCKRAFEAGWAGAAFKTICSFPQHEASPRFSAIRSHSNSFAGFKNI